MEEAIQEHLERICSTPGVLGAFVSDKEGALVKGVVDQNIETLSQSSWIMGKSIAGVESFGRTIQEIDLRFEKERIIFKNLVNGYLYLLCKPRLNIFLLWLSTNLEIEALDERLNGIRGGPVVLSHQKAAEKSRLEDEGSSPEKMEGGEKFTMGGERPGNLAGKKMVEAIEEELRKVMGPIAPLIVADRLSTMGQTRTSFDPQKFDEFLKAISGEIPDNAKRMDFQRIVRARCSR